MAEVVNSVARWTISVRAGGEVLAVRAQGAGIDLGFVGAPPGFTSPEVEGWLGELMGMAGAAGIEPRSEPGSPPAPVIPRALHQALTGLLFLEGELWGESGDRTPCAIALMEAEGMAAIGWSGSGRVEILADGKPFEPTWILVRDEQGREARACLVEARQRLSLNAIWSCAAAGSDPLEGSIEAEWPGATASAPAEADSPQSFHQADPRGELDSGPSSGPEAPEPESAASSGARTRGFWHFRSWMDRLASPRASQDVPLESALPPEPIAHDVPGVPDLIPEPGAFVLEAPEVGVTEALAGYVAPTIEPPPSAPGIEQETAAGTAAAAFEAQPGEPHIEQESVAGTAAPAFEAQPGEPGPDQESVAERAEAAVGAPPAESSLLDPPPVESPESGTAPELTLGNEMSWRVDPFDSGPATPAEPESAPQDLVAPELVSGSARQVDPFDLGPASWIGAENGAGRVKADSVAAVGPALLSGPAAVERGSEPGEPLRAAPEVLPTIEPVATPGSEPDPEPASVSLAADGAAGSPEPRPVTLLEAARSAMRDTEIAPAGPRPTVRRPAWPEPDASVGVAGRPFWRRPWFVVALVAVLFGTGWFLGRVDFAARGKGLVAALNSLGLGPARYDVTVTSRPAGAWITVDGMDQARRTPATLRLKPGSHEVVLSFSGVGGSSHTVEGKRGQTVALDVELWGGLKVAVPGGSAPISVAVDGMPRGYAPLDVERLSPGIHRLQFSGRDVAPWEQTVEVHVNRTAEVVAQPIVSPATGLLEVRATLADESGSEPLAGATVWIDGAMRGSTPLKLELPRGPHSVRVRYRSEEAPVEVVDLPGGNQRFANLELGLDADAPRLTASLADDIPLDRPTVLSASLDRAREGDLREMWLHVRTPEGAWRRYPMTVMKATGGLVGVVVFPTVLFDSHGRTAWYASAATPMGDEYFTEIQPARAATKR